MTPDATDAIERLQRLRRFEGPPREFWPALAEALHALTGAERTVLVTRRAGDTGEWQALGAAGGPWRASLRDLSAVATQAAGETLARQVTGGRTLAGLALETDEDGRHSVAVFELPAGADDGLERARLAADVPAGYRRAQLLRQSRADLTHFAGTLDLLAALRDRQHFLEAALTICNEIAARHRCHQVALGWLRGRYVELQALSHRESFDRRMEAVQRIEAAMEEALDQDDEVVWPAAGRGQVTRDHERCAAQMQTPQLASIPLRAGGALVGALWAGRAEPPFSAEEIRALRVAADEIAAPLIRLRERDRWWGARWKTDLEEAARRHWNLSHPWLKLGAGLAALGLLLAFTVPLRYRVEATFVVRPGEQSLIGPAFDGYLRSVSVQAGDSVPAGAELFALDDATWRLQEAGLLADARRYQAEAEQARGQGKMAEMRIDQAQAQQVAAQLETVRLNLANAVAKAPFAGLVIEETQLRERIGSAVTRTDVLLRLARAGSLYAELDVPEHAIDEIADGATGELAFNSRPETSYPIRLERIEPAAVTKDTGSVFPARAAFTGRPPDWTRPGMTGLAKIDAGRRTAFWQLTHRLVDWLRLKLWW